MVHSKKESSFICMYESVATSLRLLIMLQIPDPQLGSHQNQISITDRTHNPLTDSQNQRVDRRCSGTMSKIQSDKENPLRYSDRYMTS